VFPIAYRLEKWAKSAYQAKSKAQEMSGQTHLDSPTNFHKNEELTLPLLPPKQESAKESRLFLPLLRHLDAFALQEISVEASHALTGDPSLSRSRRFPARP
jgi:hypothetical protein